MDIKFHEKCNFAWEKLINYYQGSNVLECQVLYFQPPKVDSTTSLSPVILSRHLDLKGSLSILVLILQRRFAFISDYFRFEHYRFNHRFDLSMQCMIFIVYNSLD